MIAAQPAEAATLLTPPEGGYIHSHGPQLVEQGYQIAPIAPGTKAPMIAGWQERPFNSEDLSRKFRGFGVGIKTGVLNADGHAVVALDSDVMDAAVAAKLVDWCEGRFGKAPLRVGQAPKVTLAYRTSTPFRKKRSRTFRSPDGVEHAVEVLGKGQQFVAYAIHPGTGRPYSWSSGELVDTPVAELQEITEQQAFDFLDHFESIVPDDWTVIRRKSVRRAGKKDHNTSKTPHAPIWKLSIALDAIPITPDDPRAEWIEIGMALYHATNGSQAGLALWDERSSKGNKYEFGEPARLWKGFGAVSGARLSAATIFRMADRADPSWRDRAMKHESVENARVMQGLAGKLEAAPAARNHDTGGDEAERHGDRNASDLAPLDTISLADLHGKPVPPRRWIVDGLIPDRNVTDLSGAGGTGKSLLALQLGVTMTGGGKWLGYEPTRGRVLYVSAEDEIDEFHRRVADVAERMDLRLADLGDFYLVDLTRAPSTELARTDPGDHKALVMTELFRQLQAAVDRLRPKLVILDTRADVYGGNEIDRVQVRRFIHSLQELCRSQDAAVLLLSHPSRSGLTTGDGQSGSTGWINSARSGLYLTRADKDDPDRRMLEATKANYGPAATEIALRWENGVFRRIDALVDSAGEPLGREALERRVEARFLQHLAEAELRGEYVNDAATGPHYAPKVFASLDASAPGRIGKKHYADAMWRLRSQGQIKLVNFGSPSKGWRKFEAVDPHAPLKRLVEWHGAGAQARATDAGAVNP